MWLKGAFTACLETCGTCRRLFLSVIEGILNLWIINLSYVDWVLNFPYHILSHAVLMKSITFYIIPVTYKNRYKIELLYLLYMKNKWRSCNKFKNSLQLAVVGFWGLHYVTCFCLVVYKKSPQYLWSQLRLVLFMFISSSWTPRGNYIESNRDDCTVSLIYAVHLKKSGSVFFEYQYIDNNIFFEFFVRPFIWWIRPYILRIQPR